MGLGGVAVLGRYGFDRIDRLAKQGATLSVRVDGIDSQIAALKSAGVDVEAGLGALLDRLQAGEEADLNALVGGLEAVLDRARTALDALPAIVSAAAAAARAQLEAILDGGKALLADALAPVDHLAAALSGGVPVVVDVHVLRDLAPDLGDLLGQVPAVVGTLLSDLLAPA